MIANRTPAPAGATSKPALTVGTEPEEPFELFADETDSVAFDGLVGRIADVAADVWVPSNVVLNPVPTAAGTMPVGAFVEAAVAVSVDASDTAVSVCNAPVSVAKLVSRVGSPVGWPLGAETKLRP